jgi:hypothetical protein
MENNYRKNEKLYICLVSNESIPASQGSYTPFISLSPLKEQAIGSICRM